MVVSIRLPAVPRVSLSATQRCFLLLIEHFPDVDGPGRMGQDSTTGDILRGTTRDRETTT
jgi:hypothetical protein